MEYTLYTFRGEKVASYKTKQELDAVLDKMDEVQRSRHYYDVRPTKIVKEKK